MGRAHLRLRIERTGQSLSSKRRIQGCAAVTPAGKWATFKGKNRSGLPTLLNGYNEPIKQLTLRCFRHQLRF